MNLSSAMAAGPGHLTDSVETIIEAHNLVVDYHTNGRYHRALDDVTVRINAGEAVGVIGESGSGKTTLARSLVGLIPPKQGHVLHRGHDIYALNERNRFRTLGRDATIVFQDPRSSINPRLTTGAAVRDPLTVLRIGTTRKRRQIVNQLLRDVGLPSSMTNRPTRALSGGQLQRVALARALSVQPSLVIADEPTSALDVSVEAQILNLLRELSMRHNLAILIISHDMRVIRFLADHTIVMHGGTIVEEGPTEKIYQNPEHDYTKSLLSAAPVLRLADYTT